MELTKAEATKRILVKTYGWTKAQAGTLLRADHQPGREIATMLETMSPEDAAAAIQERFERDGFGAVAAQ